MEIPVEIAPLSEKGGVSLIWKDGFEIEFSIVDGKTAILVANKEGLIALASHLLALSQEHVVSGAHIHLDEYGGLEDGSSELILQRK
jgi:hypothetical protein